MKTTRKAALLTGAIVGAELGAALVATSGYMHRLKAHNPEIKVNPKVEFLARTSLWLAGVRPRDWIRVHRKHHANADQAGDPHSPVNLGRWGAYKLLVKNVMFYRKDIENDNRAAVGYDTDLQPDRLDKALFDKKKSGLATSFAGHMAVTTAFGMPYVGPVSFAVSKLSYERAGAIVNASGHLGARPLHALCTGYITPHEDNTYGSNSPLIAWMTVGEGWQQNHHKDETNIDFRPADNKDRFWYKYSDPVAILLKQAIAHGLVASPSSIVASTGPHIEADEPVVIS